MSKPDPATHDIQEHALLVRIAHWGMALAIIIMLGSGWRIYDSDPIFGDYRFPLWATLGGDPAVSKVAHMDPGVANALNWHFAGMWLLALSWRTDRTLSAAFSAAAASRNLGGFCCGADAAALAPAGGL
jgi:hypothetical protein